MNVLLYDVFMDLKELIIRNLRFNYNSRINYISKLHSMSKMVDTKRFLMAIISAI